jgi:hypothetical protein
VLPGQTAWFCPVESDRETETKIDWRWDDDIDRKMEKRFNDFKSFLAPAICF